MRTFLPRLKKFALTMIALTALAFAVADAGDPIEIDREFTLFTSQQMQGYLKPLFTTVEQSFNGNIYTTAMYPETWSISLDISASGMIIPGSQKDYDAELPSAFGNPEVTDDAYVEGRTITRQVGGSVSQPTIYGGESHAVYSAPQNPTGDIDDDGYPDSLYKSIAFIEGNNVSFMSGVPVFQIIAAFPTRTEVRLRGAGAGLQGEPMIYMGILANQQVDHFFDLFDPRERMGIALNGSYHAMFRNPGIDIRSFSVGAHFSKGWDNGFTGYFGMQYENMIGFFHAVKETDDTYKDYVDSPYEEIRNAEDIRFAVETFTNFRVLGGFSYQVSIFEFHVDMGWASQPMVTGGITFRFAEWGEKVQENKFERYQNIENIEKIKKEETKEEGSK